MEPTWWILFTLAGVSMVAAVVFFSLWLTARRQARILRIQLKEAKQMETMLYEFREHTMLAAKSAALEAGQQLSSKLLDDHKRETETARELHGKLTKNITESLTEQVQKISHKLASLNDQHSKQSDTLSTIWKSLTTPIGAGKIAEIGLENVLKSFGLEAGRDFVTQFTIQGEAGKTLRPDVVIFMPHGRVMVVDAKASQHLMDVASAHDKQHSEAAKEQLKVTMNKHLRDLASKDYRAAIQAMYDAKDFKTQISSIWSVMYVPSEVAIEHIKEADPEFMSKIHKADIILAGPGSLHGLLSIARLSVENQRQIENSTHIVKGAEALLDGITTAFSYVENLGKSLKSSVDHFNKFAGSANKSVLSKARKLEPYGITPSRGKTLPEPLPKYDVTTHKQDTEVVELELVEK